MHRSHGRIYRGSALLAALVLAGFGSAIAPPATQAVVSPDVVISQVYGGGGNANAQFTNDFVELFNRGTTPVSLAGWTIQYASTTGTGGFGATSSQLTPLSGSIAPGQYLLVQGAAGNSCSGAPCGIALPSPDITDSTPINMSGTGGKVALVTSAAALGCNGGSAPCSSAQLALVKDLVGWDGANFYEGAAAAPTTSNTIADFRAYGGCTDTDDNSADFSSGAPAPRNAASPLNVCPISLPPTGIGAATPNMAWPGGSTLLTMAVTPGNFPASTGMTVTCDLSPVGGSATQALYDDGTNGDTTSGDNLFSFSASVAGTGGQKSISCTIADAQARSTTANVALIVLATMPIGAVNGSIAEGTGCATHASPYTGQLVSVQGVIYEKTLQAISGTTDTYKGFYVQNTAGNADGDPNTSDGLFVFMAKNATMPTLDGSTYTPAVGDEVVVTGKISEYYNMTELTSPTLTKPVLRSGVVVDAEVPPVVADPPAAITAANCYWERLQGMRVQVPENSVVLGGRNVFSPADAEIWLAAPDSTVAQRSDPYERRAFRDAHPLDDNYDANAWDGNGYRILMGSLGIKAAAGDAQALIDPGRTFDTLTNTPAGGLNYTFSKYRIEISDQPAFAEGPDPAQNNRPSVFDRSTNYSIVDYNLENLYDFRNNPFSGCDFAGDSGCPKVAPFLSAVNPPYDYVPASDEAYQARLTDIATQIVNDLHSPDILMVQEVENQDICTVTDGALDCGTTDNRDGKPDVLQELALKISSLGGPGYDAAFDRDSSDLRGIAPAFLYRTDRVELAPAAGDPVLGATPAIGNYTSVPYDSDVSNPKTLNAELPAGFSGACETSWVFPRAADVALFRVYAGSVGSGNYREVYVVNDHFKSGPDTCVAHRTEQAKYNAALVRYIENAKPGARVVVGGDLNVYPRPDDPFAPIGQAGSSDQLGSLYDPDLGLTNLWQVELAQAPEGAYSYVYLGQAQTLDQVFVNGPMLTDLAEFRIAHINSDFPAEYAGDVARGTSDHDPNVASYVFNKAPSVGAGGPYSVTAGGSVTVNANGTDPEGDTLTYAWDLDNDGTFETPGQSATLSVPLVTPPSRTIRVQVTDSWGATATAEATVNVTWAWSGPFQPVDPQPTLNVMKAGAAVPIKFSLTGYQGMNVFAAGYPQSQKIACDGSDPLDTIEQTVTAGASGLQYDATTGLYTYVWKTDRSWANTCRSITLTLADGSTHVALFKFSK